ncbi:MAG: NAD(P)H-dependent glycerol-3-phosphate dehydrogenase [Gemmatimonadota bacterium]|nr:NAD(P)H-dependent glycerol-3-phosphate dehydrogenase [Gemmatimonadota bacterium]
MNDRPHVSVVGAGAWGTALGIVLVGRGHEVRVWSFEADVASSINKERRNPYLPGVELPEGLISTTDLGSAVSKAQLVVSATPSQFVREVMHHARQYMSAESLLVSASKGIELGTNLRMEDVLTETLSGVLSQPLSVLSGPSFAAEVAVGVPTTVVVASRDEAVASRVREFFQGPSFRIYTNTDVIGVELGGALKNIVALAAGVTGGLGMGHNTTAAVITRGLAEITRLGLAVGADQATFYGLAGVGDLVLTCNASLSRNRTVGYRLGQGESLEEILSDMKAVAEGVKTTEAAYELAAEHQVEMPITEQMYAVVHQGRNPSEAVRALMNRDPKSEEWS